MALNYYKTFSIYRPTVMNCKSLMESLKKEASAVAGTQPLAVAGTQPFDPHLINDGGHEVTTINI